MNSIDYEDIELNEELSPEEFEKFKKTFDFMKQNKFDMNDNELDRIISIMNENYRN